MNINDFTTEELNEIIDLNTSVSKARARLADAITSINKLQDIYPHLDNYIFQGLDLTTNLNGIRSELSSMEHSLSGIENCTSPH